MSRTGLAGRQLIVRNRGMAQREVEMRPLWCKGTSRSVSGLLRPRGAGGKALPLVVRTGRGKLRDQDLRGREELTLTLPAALMNGWILGLWPERERLGTEPNHAARCPSPSPRPSPVRNRRSGTHRHAQRRHVPVSGIRRRQSRWRRLLIPGFWGSEGLTRERRTSCLREWWGPSRKHSWALRGWTG